MLHQVTVKGLTLDPLTSSPILLLRDESHERTLPIWVAVPEANAIALELEQVSAPRPMTHDLLREIIDRLEAKVVQVVIHDVKDSTYYAEIHIRSFTGAITLDSRPSDAIALALRTNSPIFVDEEVFGKVLRDNAISAKGWEDDEDVREWIDALSPEDFEQEHS